MWGAPADLLGGTRAPVVAEFWDIVAKADILLVPLQRCNFLSAKIITKNERRLTPYTFLKNAAKPQQVATWPQL